VEPHTAKVEIWLAIIGVVVLAIIGIVRSRTREELADLVERRERAAAAREEEQQPRWPPPPSTSRLRPARSAPPR